jgi:hypothetical protein
MPRFLIQGMVTKSILSLTVKRDVSAFWGEGYVGGVGWDTSGVLGSWFCLRRDKIHCSLRSKDEGAI